MLQPHMCGYIGYLVCEQKEKNITAFIDQLAAPLVKKVESSYSIPHFLDSLLN